MLFICLICSFIDKMAFLAMIHEYFMAQLFFRWIKWIVLVHTNFQTQSNIELNKFLSSFKSCCSHILIDRRAMRIVVELSWNSTNQFTWEFFIFIHFLSKFIFHSFYVCLWVCARAHCPGECARVQAQLVQTFGRKKKIEKRKHWKYHNQTFLRYGTALRNRTTRDCVLFIIWMRFCDCWQCVE